MWIHPQPDPVAFSIGPLSVHWYGLMYLLAFTLFLVLGKRRANRADSVISREMLDDVLFYGVLGVIVGGRLGYVLFYRPEDYFAQPLSILNVQEGGMSFHGGFLGVLVAVWGCARKYRLNFWQLADFIAPLVPLGLAVGRLGNFINGELWGRVTSPDAWFAMIFPQAYAVDMMQSVLRSDWAAWFLAYGGLPRHPSQLYQFALEGVLLFAVLWGFTARPRALGQASAVFLMGYGGLRFIAEFAREPDSFLGLLALNFSMGQWLSLPMIAVGVWLWIRSKRV